MALKHQIDSAADRPKGLAIPAPEFAATIGAATKALAKQRALGEMAAALPLAPVELEA